jgi:hypothetical protein
VLSLPTPPKCFAASVLATLHAAFARKVRARPSGCSTFEAIWVHLRYGPVARSPSISDGFVNRLQDFQFPSFLLFKLRGSNFYPGETFTHCSCQPSLDAHFSILYFTSDPSLTLELAGHLWPTSGRLTNHPESSWKFLTRPPGGALAALCSGALQTHRLTLRCCSQALKCPARAGCQRRRRGHARPPLPSRARCRRRRSDRRWTLHRRDRMPPRSRS